ncbi:hypothetical protein EJ08DRAFT_654492, partial [Tothia fuscella]
MDSSAKSATANTMDPSMVVSLHHGFTTEIEQLLEVQEFVKGPVLRICLTEKINALQTRKPAPDTSGSNPSMDWESSSLLLRPLSSVCDNILVIQNYVEKLKAIYQDPYFHTEQYGPNTMKWMKEEGQLYCDALTFRFTNTHNMLEALAGECGEAGQLGGVKDLRIWLNRVMALLIQMGLRMKDLKNGISLPFAEGIVGHWESSSCVNHELLSAIRETFKACIKNML